MAFRLSAFYFAFFAQVGLYVAYFPLYLAARGLDAVAIAAVLALPPLVRIFAPTGWGWLADRTGAHRAIVAFGCAVTAGGFALLPFTSQFALLIAVMSLLNCAAMPLMETLTLGSLAGDHGRYGPIRLWGSVGFILAVLAGGVWLERWPVTALPAATAVLMASAFVIALALPAGRTQAPSHRMRLRITPEIAALLGAGFFNAVAHGALYAFLSLHLESEGYRGTTIGLLWTLGVAAEVLVFLWLPQLFRRYPLSTILVFSVGCGVVRFLAIGWMADHLWIVLVAQLAHAATFGSFHAASVATVHRVFPEHAQARGQTLFSSVSYGAGAATGLLLAGWAWAGGGAPFAFSVASGAALVGAFLAFRLKRVGL